MGIIPPSGGSGQPLVGGSPTPTSLWALIRGHDVPLEGSQPRSSHALARQPLKMQGQRSGSGSIPPFPEARAAPRQVGQALDATTGLEKDLNQTALDLHALGSARIDPPSLCLPEAPPPGRGGHLTNLCRPARLAPPGKADAPRAQEASEPSSPSEARLPYLMSGPLAEPLPG